MAIHPPRTMPLRLDDARPGIYFDRLLDLKALLGFWMWADRTPNQPRSLASTPAHAAPRHHGYYVALLLDGRRIEHTGITLEHCAKSVLRSEFPDDCTDLEFDEPDATAQT